MRFTAFSAICLVMIVVAIGCGPSESDVRTLVSAEIKAAIDAIPTAEPTPTSMPISTPQPTATPQPTPTVYPTPTPQPTATPQPTPTPQPTATPQPTPTPQTLLDFNGVYARVWPSVFLIRTNNASGTGWLVDSGLILTNAHVVTDVTTVTVYQPALQYQETGNREEYKSFIAAVRARDEKRDIALLTFNQREVTLRYNAKILPIGSVGSIDIAKPLLALGYSDVQDRDLKNIPTASANVGVLSQIVSLTGPTRYGLNLVMDAPVDPGDSGGPVVDRLGRVVGMNRAVQVSTSSGQRVVGTFYAVHSDEIIDALPDLKAGRSR
jgi:S1-C subfamily serine protease